MSKHLYRFGLGIESAQADLSPGAAERPASGESHEVAATHDRDLTSRPGPTKEGKPQKIQK